MDGTPIDQVTPLAAPPLLPVVDDATAEPIDLPQRKRELVEAARSFDPLRPLRRHPVLTVAAAAALGLVAASPAAARTAKAATSNGLVVRLSRMAATSLWSYIAAVRVAKANAAVTSAAEAQEASAVPRADPSDE